MHTKGSGGRVLRFAVTGALLGGGPLGCDRRDGADAGKVQEPRADDSKTNNMMKVEEPDDVDVRKVEDLDDVDDGKTNNVVKVEEPDNVNVRKVEDPEPPLEINPGPDEGGHAPQPGGGEGPADDPDKEPTAIVNTSPTAEPSEPPKTRIRTNVRRVDDPKTP